MTTIKKYINHNIQIMMTLLLALTLLACGSEATEPTQEFSNQEDEVTSSTCIIKKSVNDFDNFLGIAYGTNELLLEKILGKFTGGEYSSDSLSFIYYFKEVKGAPITVWVDAQSQKVITVFMEILGYEHLFESDLNEAIEKYNISDCDARFFGMKYEELVPEFGKPAQDEVYEDGVRSIDYDSDDYKYSVNFKFYPEQDNMCSSVSVNWFY